MSLGVLGRPLERPQVSLGLRGRLQTFVELRSFSKKLQTFPPGDDFSIDFRFLSVFHGLLVSPMVSLRSPEQPQVSLGLLGRAWEASNCPWSLKSDGDFQIFDVKFVSSFLELVRRLLWNDSAASRHRISASEVES